MWRQGLILLTGGLLAAGLWSTAASRAQAQDVNRFYHYPYYYYPHNYWPNTQRWPEQHRAFQRPPRWMAHPPYQDPAFRYELGRPMKYYRGNHFWLDQF